jgi:hypothetical protein
MLPLPADDADPRVVRGGSQTRRVSRDGWPLLHPSQKTECLLIGNRRRAESRL